MDFDPHVVGLFLNEDFWKMIFWLVLNETWDLYIYIYIANILCQKNQEC
jgi:hypothetical protein